MAGVMIVTLGGRQQAFNVVGSFLKFCMRALQCRPGLGLLLLLWRIANMAPVVYKEHVFIRMHWQLQPCRVPRDLKAERCGQHDSN